ncbi:MAG: NADH:ubiquinone reductase (Na(+)-transporting) subunit B [Bacteroidota bacterium]|nr:NADH:ubiquinone reductase (Na(+)-transporting) subunit B [Bacteroidota bacterium]
MKFLRDFLDKQKPHFEKGGKFEKFYYIFEAHETLLFAPNHTTGFKGVQVRDAIDLKRLMITVVIALIPTLIFGIWNVGHQHFLAVGEAASFWDKMGVGAWVVLPIVAVSYGVGLSVEFTFATIRRHPINEGFLVTGMLIPLIMPPTIPLWQVALATVFGVIIGKEVFGGTGMNILNPALTARAFLYFAYPSDISGEVWTYLGGKEPIDAYSGATALGIAAEANVAETTVPVVQAFDQAFTPDLYSELSMFLGTIPGSIGETSFLMCMIGAAILVITGVGSWKIMVSVLAGGLFMAVVFNLIGLNQYMLLPAHYHLLLGGMAFTAVYMATDPVSASQTELGKWIYGFLIGVFTVLIRVVNPAYPEGSMLAVLLMNVFAPLIDYYIVEANKKRRLQRATV